MKIILVGSGKVGTALARQLSEEGHNVTVVDTNKARVEHLIETYDVLGIAVILVGKCDVDEIAGKHTLCKRQIRCSRKEYNYQSNQRHIQIPADFPLKFRSFDPDPYKKCQ